MMVFRIAFFDILPKEINKPRGKEKTNVNINISTVFTNPIHNCCNIMVKSIIKSTFPPQIAVWSNQQFGSSDNTSLINSLVPEKKQHKYGMRMHNHVYASRIVKLRRITEQTCPYISHKISANHSAMTFASCHLLLLIFPCKCSQPDHTSRQFS